MTSSIVTPAVPSRAAPSLPPSHSGMAVSDMTSQQPSESGTSLINNSLSILESSTDPRRLASSGLPQGVPVNLTTRTFSVLRRRSDSRLNEFCDLVKSWEKWDTLTALANYHSIVKILFGFLKEAATPDRCSHIIAREIFGKTSQDAFAVATQMTLILRNSVTYKQFLACRGPLAQNLLDLVQDLLDSSSAPRPLLSKALLRLSRASGLHPRCFALSGVEKVGQQVAAGGFGDIWKSLVHGQSVSIKIMRVFRDKDVKAILKEFGREALIWRQLSHPNLLPFFGLYYLESRLCLVSPWMENGHLLEFLRNTSVHTNRLSLILDVAMGLDYLHAEQIVHGDLKGTNILITPSGRACIADFGLSTITDAVSLRFTHSTTNVQGGSARYQAPEVLSGERPNHYGSDVYAFACVCYEILTGKVPFFQFLNDIIVSIKVIGGDRPSWPEIPNPDIRPSAQQIICRLVNPPIKAKAAQSTTDWDETSTSKFRRRLQDGLLLPSMTEIKGRLFGNETVEDCVDCFPKHLEQDLTPNTLPLENLSSLELHVHTSHLLKSPSRAGAVTPSLADLRRRLVRFLLPEEGLSFTVDVGSCAGGIEVLKKVLMKFGKGGIHGPDSEDPDVQLIDDGGLSVDGWGIYFDLGQDDGPGEPLSEAELMSICHAPPDHPMREHGLALCRTDLFRHGDDAGSSATPRGKFLATSKATKRASSVNILSGFGVHDLERTPVEPPSPTSMDGWQSPALSGPPTPPLMSGKKRPGKLHKFFEQRPPSELITDHLTEYFPTTDKKVLARTARESMSLGNNSPGPSSTPKIPIRSNTSAHPYSNPQSSALQAPLTSLAYKLSLIEESFNQASSSGISSPPSYTVGRSPFTPGAQWAVLADLRRKLVRFLLPEEGLSFTIDVGSCAGGIEILKKVLIKFGKGGIHGPGPEDPDVQSTDYGGLSIDGWGIYLDLGQDDGPGEPLSEAELMSICHAPPNHPVREHGLTLRRTGRTDDAGSSAPAHGKFLATSKATMAGRQNPALSGPPTPPLTSGKKRPGKLHNFVGQRPPSELITDHLTEYFPMTDKNVLARTARANARSKRDSASWNPLPSRFSSSTQGSAQHTSMSSPRTSFSSHTPPPAPLPDARPPEDLPPISLSTDDGRPVDLSSDGSVGPETQKLTAHPRPLPPIPFPIESFSESLESIAGPDCKRMSRSLSAASRHMSYMTEVRNKRDRTGTTASMLAVDEITADLATDHSDDEWIKVESQDGLETDNPESTFNDDTEDDFEDDVEDIDEDETLNGDDKPGNSETRQATTWIKGALIGAGSSGKVYLGMDTSTGLLMAVKQVDLPTGSAANQERKKSMLSAFERQVELLKNLQHENIVQYLYSSSDDEFLNIFLEYMPGGSVTALLRNYGAFEEPLVKDFVRQILEGLNYLHERDIIHRDIKGAKILVDNKGGVKISGFRISKKVEDNLLTGNHTRRPSLQGSVFWMAPEVLKQSGHTCKADIWSLGCLVVEMLTGEHPWPTLTQMQAIFKIGSSAKPAIPSNISSDAENFLLRTFELDHEARPSAAELLQHAWVCKKPAANAAKVEVTA